MKNLYLAPLEGVTDSIYRNTFNKYYGGVEKFFTPFISPNSTFKFTTREYKDIDPNKNDVKTTVPQLLTNKSEHFLWAVGEIASLGFGEINFNLGCPSGTVVAKKKGSGLLFYPEELDKMLYEIFDGLDTACAKTGAKVPSISIKTRLGKTDPEDFYEILDIYNKYPISELTIHPRIQSDFYREPIRPEYFDYAVAHSKAPLVFNGDIKTVSDIDSAFHKYDTVNAIMIGRGLISNPELALEYKEAKKYYGNGDNWDGSSNLAKVSESATSGVNLCEPSTLTEFPNSFNYKKFHDFHDDLLSQYTEILSGEKPVLHRMKEFLVYWQVNFTSPEEEKLIKKMRKANKLAEYKALSAQLLAR